MQEREPSPDKSSRDYVPDAKSLVQSRPMCPDNPSSMPRAPWKTPLYWTVAGVTFGLALTISILGGADRRWIPALSAIAVLFALPEIVKNEGRRRAVTVITMLTCVFSLVEMQPVKEPDPSKASTVSGPPQGKTESSGSTSTASPTTADMHEQKQTPEPKKNTTHPPSTESINGLANSEIIRVRKDAVGRINESYEWMRDYRAEIQRKSSLPPTVQEPITDKLHNNLSEWYRQTHLPEAKRIRRELIGHINGSMPQTGAEGLYDDPPAGMLPVTKDVDMQLYDLRILLNEVERENNLPLSLQNVNRPY